MYTFPAEGGGLLVAWLLSRCWEGVVAVEERRKVCVAPLARARDLIAWRVSSTSRRS